MKRCLPELFCGIGGGRENWNVAGAAAQMTAEKFAKLFLARIGLAAKITVKRHQNAGGAEAALQRVSVA